MTKRPLEGRTGLVTGAGRGIGRAIVERLVAAGARVAAFDLTAPANGGDRVLPLAGDVRDPERVEAAVHETCAAFGRLDFVVNNAGVRPRATLADHTDELWRETIDVNLTGVFNFCRAALPHLTAGAAIVNIASTAALLGAPDRVAYCASKAGVVGLTLALAVELGPVGIRVNAIAPGPVQTPMAAIYHDDPKATARILNAIPAGRWGHPEEIAAMTAFLVGPDAAFVNGAVVTVDGGFAAGKTI